MEAAADALSRLHAGELDCSVATVNAPSPFSANLTFSQVGRYMYADDTPERAYSTARTVRHCPTNSFARRSSTNRCGRRSTPR